MDEQSSESKEVNSTQLNKPPRKMAHRRKEAYKSLIISPILKITVKSLFSKRERITLRLLMAIAIPSVCLPVVCRL